MIKVETSLLKQEVDALDRTARELGLTRAAVLRIAVRHGAGALTGGLAHHGAASSGTVMQEAGLEHWPDD